MYLQIKITRFVKEVQGNPSIMFERAHLIGCFEGISLVEVYLLPLISYVILCVIDTYKNISLY